MLIESMWNKILDTEIEKSGSASPQNKISILSSKLKSLGKMYASSQKYFPMGKDIDFLRITDWIKKRFLHCSVIIYLFPEFIVKKLELYSVQIHGDYEWVFKTLLAVGIPLPKVFEVYNRFVHLASKYIWICK